MVSIRPIGRFLVPLLYACGLLWLSVLAFLSAWPDMEAGVFDAETRLVAETRLSGLRCPWLLTPGEVGRVRLRVANPSDRPAAFLLRARFSRGYVSLLREESQSVRLLPGERRDLAWTVRPGDAAYERVVMVRILATRSAAGPARQAACGVLVTHWPASSGDALFLGGLLLGLAAWSLAVTSWWRRRRPLGAEGRALARRQGLLSGLVLVSLGAGLAGWWLASHLLLLAAATFGVVLLQQAFRPR